MTNTRSFVSNAYAVVKYLILTYSVKKLTRSASGARPSKLSAKIHGCMVIDPTNKLKSSVKSKKHNEKLKFNLEIKHKLTNIKKIMMK